MMCHQGCGKSSDRALIATIEKANPAPSATTDGERRRCPHHPRAAIGRTQASTTQRQPIGSWMPPSASADAPSSTSPASATLKPVQPERPRWVPISAPNSAVQMTLEATMA